MAMFYGTTLLLKLCVQIQSVVPVKDKDGLTAHYAKVAVYKEENIVIVLFAKGKDIIPVVNVKRILVNVIRVEVLDAIKMTLFATVVLEQGPAQRLDVRSVDLNV